MSISERERQALDSIESELARTAPRLTSMLAMFSRLTAGEQMPAREPVRKLVGPPYWIARCHVGRKTRGWLCLAVAAVLFVLLMTLTHGTQVSPCTHPLTSACERAPGGLPASTPRISLPRAG